MVTAPAVSANVRAWHELGDELACWQEAGRVPTLWWRDDDATEPVPALERLLSLSQGFGVPVALAVIPEGITASLPAALSRCARVSVLQHGYAHRDHAASDEPSAELGSHRAASVVLDELALGGARLRQELGELFQAVLVPPWNRIADALVPSLAGLGLTGLSRFSPRQSARTAQGILVSNCHVDPVDWRAGGVFRGEERTLSGLLGHLRARRLGAVDAREPTGVLTHHRRHDDDTWAFMERLLSYTRARSAVRWLHAAEVFPA